MTMQLRPLPPDRLRWLHETELQEAFPPEELKPLAAMETLVRRGVYHPVGAWEGRELVGYLMLWTGPVTGYVLVDYLGVPAARRNQGLGGAILRRLQAGCQSLDGILVESETPLGGPTDALRRRRLGFYQRSGFVPLSYECLLFGVCYRTFLCSPNGRGREDQAQAAHRAMYTAQFPPAVLRRSVQIPWDPAAPLAEGISWATQTDLPGGEEKEVRV